MRGYTEGMGCSHSLHLPLLICHPPRVYFQYFLQLLVPHKQYPDPSHTHYFRVVYI